MAFSAVQLSFDPQENINTLASAIGRKEPPKAYQRASQSISLFLLLKWKTVIVTQCLTLCYPMGYSPPGSSVYGILQARLQEWVAVPFSRRSSQPRDWTQVSRIAGWFFTIGATREALGSSVQFSRSVVSDSLRPHGLQHARPPCPSPTPRVYSNSCPLSQWCHPVILSSDVGRQSPW